MKIVLDSSSFIWSSKLGLIRIIQVISKEIIIPFGVYTEFEKGLKTGFRDAYQMMLAVESGKIKKIKADEEEVLKLVALYGLSPIDAEIVALGRGGYTIFSDDQIIINASTMEDIKIFTTADLVIYAFRKGMLSDGQLSEILKLLHILNYPRLGILKIEEEVGKI